MVFEEACGGSVGLLLRGMGQVWCQGLSTLWCSLKHLSGFPKASSVSLSHWWRRSPGASLFPSSPNLAALTILHSTSLGPPGGFFPASASIAHQGCSWHHLCPVQIFQHKAHSSHPQVLSWTKLVRLFSWSAFSFLSQNCYLVGLIHIFYDWIDTIFVEEVRIVLKFMKLTINLKIIMK